MQSEQFQLHAEIEQSHWWFVARRRILKAVINAVLPPSAATTIVDVGCGTGANLAGLADQYQCIGLDTSREAVRLAAERFPQVRFVHAEAHDAAAIIGTAQLVLLTDVLEHVADDFRMLSELLSMAAGGTYFLLTVPAEAALWSEHDRAFGHYRRYERDRFEQLWRGLDVTELFVSHFNARLYPVVKAVRRWNRWRGKAAGAAGTDFSLPNRLANSFLTRCFADERRRLVALAKGEHRRPYRKGVSLMALLRRGHGPIEPRFRPGAVSVDLVAPLPQPATAH
jgi:SAM-dependent methyltransferase